MNGSLKLDDFAGINVEFLSEEDESLLRRMCSVLLPIKNGVFSNTYNATEFFSSEVALDSVFPNMFPECSGLVISCDLIVFCISLRLSPRTSISTRYSMSL